MGTEQQIQIGDYITDEAHMVAGPVISETTYPLVTRAPVPCWVIRNNMGLEQLIFKWASELVRKGNAESHNARHPV